MRYDKQEAKYLLGCFIEQNGVTNVEKLDAAKALVAEIDHFGKELGSQQISLMGLAPQVPHAFAIREGTLGKTVTVIFKGTDWVVANDRGNKELAKVELDFDPIERRFLGKGPETFVTPEPGSPVRKRSAVAVLIEAALKHLE